MYINKVTITGADDAVDIGSLYDLSDRYPFVEWGILYHPAKQGEPRYPTNKWMERFDRYAPNFVQRSLHLCGEAATDFCGGDLSIVRYSAYGDPRYDRIQVNIHDGIYHAGVENGFKFKDNTSRITDLLIRSNNVIPTIIQMNDITKYIVWNLLTKQDGESVQILFDESRGKGSCIYVPIAEDDVREGTSLIDARTFITMRNTLKFFVCGFAGGISPDNVMSVAGRINELSNLHYNVRDRCDGRKMLPPSAWIDMESGVRTDNKFDIKKVEDVLMKMEGVMKGIR